MEVTGKQDTGGQEPGWKPWAEEARWRDMTAHGKVDCKEGAARPGQSAR